MKEINKMEETKMKKKVKKTISEFLFSIIYLVVSICMLLTLITYFILALGYFKIEYNLKFSIIGTIGIAIGIFGMSMTIWIALNEYLLKLFNYYRL